MSWGWLGSLGRYAAFSAHKQSHAKMFGMISKRTKAELSPASPAPARRTRSASATHSRKAKPAAAADSVTPVSEAIAPAEEAKTKKVNSRKKAESSLAVDGLAVAATSLASEIAPETIQPIPVLNTPAVQPEFFVDHEAVARLAYSYWEARGCQGGSQEEDWFHAESELRRRQA